MPGMSGRQLDVVIVGGSLTGLFAGLSLRSLGHSVRILERYQPESLKDQGAGLRVGKDVQDFLAPYVPATERYVVQLSAIQILDRNGGDFATVKLNIQLTSWGVLYRLARSIFEGLPDGKGVYEHGCTVTSITKDDDRLKLMYTSQEASHAISADLVIGADGASSGIRQRLLPQIKRESAGYVCWRGVVPETELSTESQRALTNYVCWHWDQDYMVISYPIPSDDGSVEVGKRVVNWVWYVNYPDKEELADIMTDVDGEKHAVTMPMAKMRPEVAERQKHAARELLPPQIAELVSKTAMPFLQVVTDVISAQTSFFDGKLVLVGDAVAGPRPHVAASTSQAVFHVTRVTEYLQGKITSEQLNQENMAVSQLFCQSGFDLGYICRNSGLELGEKFERHWKCFQKLGADVGEMSERRHTAIEKDSSTTSPNGHFENNSP